MKRTRRAAPLLASIVVSLVLAACGGLRPLFQQEHVGSSEDAANIYVSAYPIVPWESIAEKLEPKHNLTTEQARNLAVQSTQSQISQFLSTFAIGLGIGLPSRTDLITTATNADGTRQVTGTQTRGSGPIPGSSGVASTATTDSLSVDLTKPALATAVDATTLLTAGTALYQQAQILDNQISKQLLPKGYRAYLVTFQINLQPRRRNLPYDAYINVSLLPGTWEQARKTSLEVQKRPDAPPPVIIHPIVITDALETTNISRSVEAVRQAALSLSGVVGNVGLNLGASGGTDKLAAVLGSAKNSLVTVGRLSDHTFRVRLGAQNSAESGMAIVPSSHNVSLMVLVRSDDNDHHLDSLTVITNTTFHDVNTGVALESGRSRHPEELARLVKERVANFGYTVTPQCGASAEPYYPDGYTASVAEKARDAIRYLDLLRAIDRGDYNHAYDTCLQRCDPDSRGVCSKTPKNNKGMSAQEEVTLQRLTASLIEFQSNSRYSKLIIKLPPFEPMVLPDRNQIVLFSDDGKTSTTAIIRGGRSIPTRALTASLFVVPAPEKTAEPAKDKDKDAPKKGGTRKDRARAADAMQAPAEKVGAAKPPAQRSLNPYEKLLPTSVQVNGGGSEIVLSFPSLALARLQAGSADDRPLMLSIGSVDVRYLTRQTEEPKEAVKNPVHAPHAVLVADQFGTARTTLQIGAATQQNPGPFTLVVSGADVREDKQVGAPGLTAKGIVLEPERAVTLVLGNLTPLRAVTITTIDKNKKPVGVPLTLNVERAAWVGSK